MNSNTKTQGFFNFPKMYNVLYDYSQNFHFHQKKIQLLEVVFP